MPKFFYFRFNKFPMGTTVIACLLFYKNYNELCYILLYTI